MDFWGLGILLRELEFWRILSDVNFKLDLRVCLFCPEEGCEKRDWIKFGF
jgi:hypothetical protein